MTIEQINHIENTTREIYSAFQGTRYVPRVQYANGVYTITRRGSLAATITAGEITQGRMYERVAEICKDWSE